MSNRNRNRINRNDWMSECFIAVNDVISAAPIIKFVVSKARSLLLSPTHTFIIPSQSQIIHFVSFIIYRCRWLINKNRTKATAASSSPTQLKSIEIQSFFLPHTRKMLFIIFLDIFIVHSRHLHHPCKRCCSKKGSPKELRISVVSFLPVSPATQDKSL